jgi:hypothetical protein
VVEGFVHWSPEVVPKMPKEIHPRSYLSICSFISALDADVEAKTGRRGHEARRCG